MNPPVSSSSYWLDHCPAATTVTRTTEDLPRAVDTVVIGCGLTGASAAYHLGKGGIQCVILDRKGISGGATGRNGGFLTPGLADSIHSSIERLGPEVTKQLYEYTQTCIDEIETFILSNEIECELRFDGEVILAVTPEEGIHLKKSYDTLNKICGANYEWWDKETCRIRCKSSSYECGMFKRRAANLWPAKLVAGIVERAIAFGANMQSHTNVLSIRKQNDKCIVITDRGDIICNHIVHATNAWSSELIPSLHGIITPVRNQVIMTSPQVPMWNFGLCANEGYEYFMQRPDGRILLGGMRNLTETAEWNCNDEGNPTDIVSVSLRSYFQKHFDDLKTHCETEHEWIGILGFSKDRNPLIGPLRSRPGEFIASGFSGHGMPFTFLAGRNVADMIMGALPAPYVAIAFDPQRFGV